MVELQEVPFVPKKNSLLPRPHFLPPSLPAPHPYRVSEVDGATQKLSPHDSRGVAVGCFVLGRSLQLGQAVSKNDTKAKEYFVKVCGH